VADVLAAFTELDRSSTITSADAVDAFDRRALQIKVADRLHNMRTIGCLDPEKQCRKADQTRDVVAPVARAVGLTDLAHELDTLAAATLRAHAPAPPRRRGRAKRASVVARATAWRQIAVERRWNHEQHRR
jgi:hypothetical protein